MSDKQFDYDLLVIGAGSGGVRAARMASSAGARVAVVERQYLGGTCVNVGCVPKKLFVYGSHFAEDFEDAQGYGWTLNSAPSFDWQTLLKHKNAEIERLNNVYGRILEQAGVEQIWGEARMLDGHTISVNNQAYSAEKILLAVGGVPYVPNVPGAELAKTSDDMFYLEALPESAVIVGGGYIAIEFAGILHGLGVKTSLMYRGDTLLRHFDQDISHTIKEALEAKGINLILQEDIIELHHNPDQSINLDLKSGGQLTTDLVMYAIGRNPRFNNLGLENTAISYTESGKIRVGSDFQTDEPSVFALGDIIDGPELTPVALAEAMAFVKTHFMHEPSCADYDNIPTAVFCQPNIATVGLTEQQAREQYHQVDIYKSQFTHMKHTLAGRSEKVFMKLVVDRVSDRVLGAHMVGPEAGEIIQGLGIAVKCGLTKAQWDSTIGIHPTAAEEFVTMRQPVRN